MNLQTVWFSTAVVVLTLLTSQVEANTKKAADIVEKGAIVKKQESETQQTELSKERLNALNYKNHVINVFSNVSGLMTQYDYEMCVYCIEEGVDLYEQGYWFDLLGYVEYIHGNEDYTEGRVFYIAEAWAQAITAYGDATLHYLSALDLYQASRNVTIESMCAFDLVVIIIGNYL